MMTEHRKVRRHSKVSALPEEVREAVHQALVSGRTYQEIVAHLQEMARAGRIAPEEVPSKSGLGRYGKDFLSRLERLKLVQEQAKVIVDQAAGSGLVLEEAAANLALNEIMTLLMGKAEESEEGLTPQVVAQIATALARLQSSSASRERVKADLRKELQKQVKGKLEELASQAQGGKLHLDLDTLRQVKEDLYGIVSGDGE